MSRSPRPNGPMGAIFAFSGMVAFITTASIYPRLTVTRDNNFTTLRYQHRQSTSSGVSPMDPGLVIAPGSKSQISSSHSSDDGDMARRNANGRPWRDKDWILDTGATTHVCTDAALMHGYTSFAHSPLIKSVGHFGPNPIPIAGIGDCTLDLPGSSHFSRGSVSDALGIERGFSAKGRLTIHNVSHIPAAGINIISWSQLRKGGLKLRLRDNVDGSLGVVHVRDGGEGREIMRFGLRDGLYFLERGGEGSAGSERNLLS